MRWLFALVLVLLAANLIWWAWRGHPGPLWREHATAAAGRRTSGIVVLNALRGAGDRSPIDASEWAPLPIRRATITVLA